jgi:dihydrofolate synthase / folylpolyglutamate synthase
MLRSLLPLCSTVVCTTSSNPRALPPATLASLAGQVDPSVEAVIEREPRRALQLSRERAGGDGAVVATGSIYLVADLLSAPGRRRASAL